MSMTQAPLQTLVSWLSHYRNAWWRERLYSLFIWTLPLPLFIFGLFSLIESMIRFSIPVKTLFIILAALPTLLSILLYLWKQWNITRKAPSDADLARNFANRNGGHGRLLNALELSETNGELSNWTLELAAQEMPSHDPLRYFHTQNLRRKLTRNLLGGVLLILVISAFPATRAGLTRAFHFRTNFDPPAEFQFEWIYSGTEYPVGEPLSIGLRVMLRDSSVKVETATVSIIGESESSRKPLQIRFENSIAQFVLTDLRGEIALTPSSGGVTGQSLKLTPYHRITCPSQQIRITPPAYSGLPIRSAETGRNVMLAGSRIEWSGQTSRKIGAITIEKTTSRSTSNLPVQFSETEFSVKFSATEEAQFRLKVADEKSRPGSLHAPLEVAILPDEPPHVNLLSPDEDGDLPGNLQIPIVAQAEDDFGVSKMYLIFRAIKSGQSGAWDSTTLPMQTIPPASAGTALRWDIGRLDLLPGDQLEFFVAVYDHNNITGPGRGISVVRRMNVPSLEQWITEAESAHEALSSELQSLSKSGEKVAKSLEALVDKLKRRNELNHEEREQARLSAERQENMINQAEQAAKELRQLSKKLEESGAVARETMDKMSRLQELMNELASEELKQSLKELQDAVQKVDQNRIKAAMEQMQWDQKEWLKKLDRTLALLEQLRLERRMDMLEQWSQRVAEQARRNEMSAISEKTNASKSDSLSREQSKLANESKSLEQEVAKTAEDAANSRHVSKPDAEWMKAAESPERAASQSLRESSDQLSKAAEQGKSAAKSGAQKAEKLAAGLAKINKSLRENAKNELASKMGHRISELLQLSDQQQKLMDFYSSLDARTPQARAVAESQAALQSGLSATMDSIASLGRETFFLPRGLPESLLEATNRMEQAKQAITERITNGAKPGQIEARGRMTEAAAQLLQAMGEMSQSSSSTGYDEMMKALAEMARKQAALNDAAQKMPGDQGMPMPGEGSPMPMPGGAQPGSTGLEQLAAEQGALSQQMQQLEQQASRMRDLTGRLDGIGDQMSDVEKDLQDRIVTERTKRQQQSILTRLLDAQRSLQRQDYSQQRESKTGLDIGPVVPNIDRSNLQNELRMRLFELSRMGVDPVWQRRIREYWNTGQQVSADSTR